MSSATIPLALSLFTPDKLEYPAYFSTKYDGVPVKTTYRCGEGYTCVTRQGENNISASVLMSEFMAVVGPIIPASWFDDNGEFSIVGELMQAKDLYAPFKVTQGIVRRQYDQSNLLVWMIFDVSGSVPFADRLERLEWLADRHPQVLKVTQTACFDGMQLALAYRGHMTENPRSEGGIAKSHAAPMVPGKRSPQYQKMVEDPTLDLWVVGVTQALDTDTKAGLGRVGGFVVLLDGVKTMVGAGKITHAESTKLWAANINDYGGFKIGLPGKMRQAWLELPERRMACVKHKRDESYKGLRQGTFQHFRDDKEEADR